MAGPPVKKKPKPVLATSVKPRSSLGSFPSSSSPALKQERGSSSENEDPPDEIHKSPFVNAIWKSDKASNRAKAVQVKEQAVQKGLAALDKFIVTMRLHLATNPSAQGRIDKILTIKKRKRSLEVYVGFLGSTGSGKTTIVNALLGMKDLLPSMTGRACTAVVVEVSKNEVDDAASKFRARIFFMTKEEWKAELEQLFLDLQPESAAMDNDDDEADPDERNDRINQAFGRVKAVYPHIKDMDGLKATSAAALLEHPSVSKLLSFPVEIAHASKTEFSKALKVYVDSGKSNSKATALWPLVKLVKVFVKAPILDTGITLVDLPGSSDSNSARSAVAAAYYKKLTITCIVANAIRGIDEKNAHDLLEKMTKRNLQLDGLYNQESLCFILSQTDRDFDKTSKNGGYIEDHSELQDVCFDDVQQVSADRKKTVDLERQAEKLTASIAKGKRSARGLLDEIEDIINPVEDGQKRKRKRPAAETLPQLKQTPRRSSVKSKLASLEKKLADVKEATQTEESQVLSLGRRKANIEIALWHARSRVASHCIKYRNALSAEAIRQDFNNSLLEMRRKPKDNLQIFCVSAFLFSAYQVQSKKVLGFATVQDTEIPSLRDWLIGTTLDTRAKYALAFLADVENFVAWIQPWINGSYGDTKMRAETRERWEPDFNGKVLELQQGFSQLSLSTATKIKNHVQTNIYSKVPGAEKIAAAKAPEIAKKWGKLRWNTHKTVNHHRGTWTNSKGDEHHWNDDIVYDVTTVLLPAWTSTFTDDIPSELALYIEDSATLISNFAESVEENLFGAEVYDALQVLQDHISRTKVLLRHQTESAFEKIQRPMRCTHYLAAPAVAGFLEPMYAKCASEGGKGHFKRNRATHKSQMKDSSKQMHQASNKAVKTALDEFLNTIPAALVRASNAVIKEIKGEVKLFFEQNTSNGIRNKTRKVISNTKIRLRDDLSSNINDLAKSWESNNQAQTQYQNEDSEDELFDDDRFFDLDKLQKGVDEEDYEYSSAEDD
ncbi:Nuclear GTPase SLIP-GC [Lachnellula cervina]|uniref:Nuclear GTPase SLIP-GC n=1 Tax=Lachnellula cervina TaxID=1316786 RepID=A0A7D8UN09_9HELO|nr:Nuclear GTPase SLIP-GC [Lachnellula cervina]